MAEAAKRVLIVEDQAIWREEFFGEALQELGFIVFPAATKEEALELLDKYQFDLAIIDLNLTEVPGNTDGLVVADYIENTGTKFPIIVVSGSEEGLRTLIGEKHHLIFAEIRKDSFDLDEFVTQVNRAVNGA